VVPASFCRVVVGQAPAIPNNIMSKDEDKNQHQLQQIINLLKFILSLDDQEIIKSTVESVIELLQEINK